MGEPSEFELIFGNPRKAFKAGETLTGSLILHVDKPHVYTSLNLKFTGKAQVGFSRETGGKIKAHFIDSERYFEADVGLLPREGISVGHHEFPFTYKLPSRIPSSFESMTGNVRYAVKATLGLGWKKTVSIKRHFVVFHPLDLNDHRECRLSAENEEEVSLCCGSGNITVHLTLPKTGYAPGEAISARAEVMNNTSSSIRKMHFGVKQIARCHAMGKTDTSVRFLQSPVPPVEHPEVPAGSTVTWDAVGALTVPVTVPTNLQGCRIIDVEHQLVLNLELGTFTCNRTAGINILIGTIPLAEEHYSSEDVFTSPPHYDSGYSLSQDSVPGRSPEPFESMEIAGSQPPAYTARQEDVRLETLM